MASRTASPSSGQRATRKRCTFAGCRKLGAPGRRRCDDHKPGVSGNPAKSGTGRGVKKLLGRAEARVFTPPLRPLNRKTSRGFEVIDFAEMIGAPLLPWQQWAVIHALELNPDGSYRFRTVLILVARQNGKALDCDVDILTANRGWTTMGELVAGDEVFHPDGHPTRVIAAHPARHGRPCYRVTTTDGRSVVVDGEHLWTVQDVRRVTKKGRRGERPVVTRPWETLTTVQMLDRGLMRGTRECAYRLPVQRALISKPAELPLDPYLLGAWLGDGDSSAAKLTVGAADLEETAAAIEAAGARIVSRTRSHTAWRLHFSIDARHKDGFESRCRRLGIWKDKHVPDLYLTAGTEQRLALLQGLMDTDGSICTGGGGSARAEFYSVNRRLADGVLYLARSLGWRATLIEGRAAVNGRDCGPKYRVCFTPQQDEPVPFRLARKAAKVQPSRSRGGELHAVSIRSIEPVETRPVRCITVDREDGLFLAGRDLVATHNSHLKRIVTLWRMFMDGAKEIVGAAQDVSLARKQWQMCQETIHACPELEEEWAGVRNVNGDEMFWAAGCVYAIKATNDKAGRGGSNDEVNIDELRAQHDWKAWGSLSKTTNARRNGQTWAMSNAGDDNSVVLNQLQEVGVAGTNPALCLLEWSAPPGCELDDVTGWQQANPGLGYTVSEAAIRSDLLTDPPNVFRTEVLCQRVDQLDGAIDYEAWKACADASGTMDALRDRLAACFDAAPDGQHFTLAVGAKLDDGRPRVELVRDWSTSAAVRAELPALLEKIGPKAFGWFPSGPAAELATTLRPLALRYNRHPGKRQEGEFPENGEISGSAASEVCQELAGLVRARGIVHAGQDLLDTHVRGASKLNTGDGWRFTRRGEIGHCDAAYAVAGVVNAALRMPVRKRARIRMIS